MTLPLTPAMVRAAYEFLNETPPFNRWNLPEADEIDFEVAIDTGHYGWVLTKRRKRVKLVVSSATIGHTVNLVATVAHEMIHLHQHQAKMPLSHGVAFKKLAARVCRYHGFDPKLF